MTIRYTEARLIPNASAAIHHRDRLAGLHQSHQLSGLLLGQGHGQADALAARSARARSAMAVQAAAKRISST
ncbi:hypothetical protein [Tsukamurella spumae]|uniref:hypothetical protein n=1 Tax=Tsukamurella spumae TaxID=44753 RepID=UPI001446CB95|nr:hypothetical protein [Tsukamurella spumae]